MNHTDRRRMSDIVEGVGANKSEKIRKLVAAGYRQADVARFLSIRDQFVSNVVRKAKEQASKATEAPVAEREAGKGVAGPFRARIDSDGRVPIPAEWLAAMQASQGTELVGRVVDGELRLVTPAMAVRRAQRLVRALIPGDDSLADSLIADRRREAVQELSDD